MSRYESHLEPSPSGSGQGEGINVILGGSIANTRRQPGFLKSQIVKKLQSQGKSQVPSPRPSPRGRGGKTQTLTDLRELQRLAGAAIFRPLTPNWKMQTRWTDGRSTREIVATFIKPNDRLTSFERLELYNRQYWFRVLDSLYEDFPGLRAVVGDRTFTKLCRAYVAAHPSRSYTLRNLGSHMAQFLEDSPEHAGRRASLAVEVARFEWAAVVAFDGPEIARVATDDLLGRDPSKLRLRLQPYITLMELDHGIDEFLLALHKRTDERGDASQAVSMKERLSTAAKRVRLPKKEKVFVAVHRADHSVYYKRLDPVAYRLLTALRDGKTLTRACAIAVGSAEAADRDWGTQLQTWFKSWMGLGWFGLRRVG